VTQYVLSPLAQTDLDDIWDYSATNWGDDQTEDYARRIQTAIELVAVDPSRGRARDYIRPGHSSFAVGSHLLFYRRTESGIDVVRILHQRMDFDRHL
jgi:toxin ParE1/3/4